MNANHTLGSFGYENARLFKWSSYMARGKTTVAAGLALISLCGVANVNVPLRIINTLDYGATVGTYVI